MLVAAIVAASAAALGAVVSAYAAYEQGQQAGKVADYNAKVAKNQATAAQYAAEVAAEQKRDETRRLIASSRNALGSSGVTSAGSPLLVLMESEENALVDIARIKAGGQAEADSLVAQSRFLSYQGRTARESGYVNAGASLLSGAANAYSAYNYGSTTTGTSPGYGRRVG